MSMYAFSDTTLAALGDAVRKKQGINERPYLSEDVIFTTAGIEETEEIEFEIPGASYVKVTVTPIEIGPSSEYYNLYIYHNYTGERFGYGNSYGGYTDLSQYPIEVITTGSRLAFSGRTDNYKVMKLPSYHVELIGLDANKNEFGRYTLSEMTNVINNMPPAVPDNAYTVTGSCQYRFAYNGWNWFINMFGDKIQTFDISTAAYMFYYSELTSIPFDINFMVSSYSDLDLSNMFAECVRLREAPILKNCRPMKTNAMFRYCRKIKNFPEDYGADWDFTKLNSQSSAYSGNSSEMFNGCSSLRKLPMKLLEGGNPYSSNSYAIYNAGFTGCFALDEIVGLPNPHYKATWTAGSYSSPFYQTFNNCCRLKEMTFAPMKENPKWSNQTIDLTTVGYAHSSIQGYVDGYLMEADIPDTKKVVDDASYQALKDDPDWYTWLPEYSRYNHDSAVNTINSLPDTTATGSNILKLVGNAGAKTDGGAINTLTEEEIAVAAAKGWTVSYV